MQDLDSTDFRNSKFGTWASKGHVCAAKISRECKLVFVYADEVSATHRTQYTIKFCKYAITHGLNFLTLQRVLYM